MGCRWKSPITAPDGYHARREAGQVEDGANHHEDPMVGPGRVARLKDSLDIAAAARSAGLLTLRAPPGSESHVFLRSSHDRRKRRPVIRRRCLRIRTRDRVLAACRGRARDPGVEALNSRKWAVRPIAGRTSWSYPRRVETGVRFVPGPKENGLSNCGVISQLGRRAHCAAMGPWPAKHDEKGRILIEVCLQRCQARPTADSPGEE
jgi:hypothetical protein